MTLRAIRYALLFSATCGLMNTSANAAPAEFGEPPATVAPTPVATPTPTPPGVIQTSVTVVCTKKPSLFNPRPAQQTPIYNIDWDLSSILDCFKDKALGTSYLQYLLGNYYQNQLPGAMAGAGLVYVSCKVCYQTSPNGTQTPPNYTNFCTDVNSSDPGIDPGYLFSPEELLCAQIALDKLGKNNGPAKAQQ